MDGLVVVEAHHSRRMMGWLYVGGGGGNLCTEAINPARTIYSLCVHEPCIHFACRICCARCRAFTYPNSCSRCARAIALLQHSCCENGARVLLRRLQHAAAASSRAFGLRLRISWAWRAVSIRCRDSSCDGPRLCKKSFALKRELSTVQKTKTEPGKTEPGFWFSLSGILFCGFCHSGKKFLPAIPLCYVMCHMLQIGCSAALCTKGSSSNCV